jgi:hypothetical protein
MEKLFNRCCYDFIGDNPETFAGPKTLSFDHIHRFRRAMVCQALSITGTFEKFEIDFYPLFLPASFA